MGRPLFLRLIIAALALGALTSAAGASVAKPKLRVSIDGNGVVASRDGRIDCGARCSARYRRGAVVSLGATPESSFAFGHWSGGCVGTSSQVFRVRRRSENRPSGLRQENDKGWAHSQRPGHRD